MKISHFITCLIAALLMTYPATVHAFWGSDGKSQSGLNLENGYDVNTVTTLVGRIVSVQAGDDRHNAQLDMDSNGARVVVVLGPQRYWAEKGIALNVGDDITIRGSKAQGTDGVVYILAQKITDTTQNAAVSLRNESGRPVWAGSGMGSGNGPTNNRQGQTPGRMGGGRRGR